MVHPSSNDGRLIDVSDELPLDRLLIQTVSKFKESRCAIVTSFGPAGLVVLNTLSQIGIRLPVVFIDTLYHFPETLAHVAHVRDHFDLDLRIFRPADDREAFERVHGPRLWERDLDLYQKLVKVRPAQAAAAGFDAWITGRRRDQSDSRAQLPYVEVKRNGFVSVNPLVSWTRDKVWDYLIEQGVPYNPLHDQGYASIGDEPLTTPVLPGEHERSGRWRGLQRIECGMHL